MPENILQISVRKCTKLSFSKVEIRSNMFLAKGFRKGLALSLIKKFREFPNKDKESLLFIDYTSNLDDIINGIYRPEVKVPRHFFLNYDERNIKISSGDGISLSISDRDNDEVVADAGFLIIRHYLLFLIV